MPIKQILSSALTCIFLMGSTLLSVSQNAPVTTCSTITGAEPGSVSVPITVTGFTSIGAISLSIDYNISVMQYVQGVPNPALGGFLSGDSDLGNGFHRITMGWFGSGSTLPDGSTIMTLVFNYVGGNSPLTWFENGSSCEYADAEGNVLNDTPASSYYINGYVCGLIENPGTISGNNSVCQGQTGEVYSVEPLANVTGYSWTVPQGAVIMNGENTNVITVNYSNQAVSGLISVYGFNPCGNGPTSQLAVTVNLLPVANAGDDLVINYGTSTTLQAAPGGSGGTYSYHWSPEELLVDPDVQNPQTVILTATTVFNLLVTNEAGQCQNTDEVIVTITGGPLNVNPLAIPATICLGESVQLYANAGGGSGNYQYTWICLPEDDPPWGSNLPNPVVSPDTSKQYFLNVFDGFTETNGFVNVIVNQLPTSYIYGDTNLCGPDALATLTVDLTGEAPWSFNYTNGITTVVVNNTYTTPYYIFTRDPGTYTIINLEDANCSGISSGSATVGVFPIPDKPEISILDYNLISSSCCGNQWYLDNELIPGATGQVYYATVSGEYYVIVTLNGCPSDTSEIVDLVVGVEELNYGKFNLFPNPADDFTKINCHLPFKGTMIITVTALDGRMINYYELKTLSEPTEFLLDIQHLNPGIYFIAISAGNAYNVGKLVVK
ncbi:MAG: T9SS type A sorting domain-containing protein [Bacteroidales bacterium]|nr:T9SS type A sorting domain-containing protein [Bacteroidales bacterium]